MKTKQKRRVLLLLTMLFSTAVFLSTATYAWFTANRTVSISSIQVNVEAQGGIQVSADGISWRSIIDVEELRDIADTYESSVNQIPEVLEPVSTIGNMNEEGRMEMFYGVVETNTGGNYILTTTQFEETRNNPNGRFIAFDLFFRLDGSAPEQLYLTPNSGVSTPDATDTGIKNATRVAFVNLGTTAIGSSTNDIQSLNAGEGASVYIWEPNYNSHTAAAIAHASNTYGLTVDGVSAVPYSGVHSEITTEDDVLVGDATEANYSQFFTDVTPDYLTEEDFSDYVPVFNLSEGITKMRLYLWIEGQDIDTENTASGGNAIFDIQLTIDPA